MGKAEIQRPIIIIGAARSGTKFLRDILASGSKTAVVPYDVNYVWRSGVSWESDDLLDPKALTQNRQRFIRKSLAGIARLKTDERLIEKTVANTLRVPFVEAVFPDAVYVHLIRDGKDVTESAMRQWKAPPNWRNLLKKLREMPLRNLDYVVWFGFNTLRGMVRGNKGGDVWGPRYAGISDDTANRPLVEVCALQWKFCVETALSDLASIPSDRVFEIRYEDLVNNPIALTDLVDKLGLPDKDVILTKYKTLVNPTIGTGNSRLSKEDNASMQTILEPTLTKLGYLK